MMFGDISVEEFLRDYWQKKPLLIRQAFPNFESPITPDELAGLACETDAARIVIGQGGECPWEVRHGPFDDDSFSDLPATHWTLLVNDTDHHLPELKAILEPFRFIPDWRIDDLMISFAVEGGTVGPHMDDYDVFLIQAQGQKRWQVTTLPAELDDFLPDLELRIMREFHAEYDWVVNPGDMLYLPPNAPHYGVAMNEGLTYSVGFRAPSQAELLERLIDDTLEDTRLKRRVTDADRHLQTNPGELVEADMTRLTDFIADALPRDPKQLRIWLGKYLSEPKTIPAPDFPKQAKQKSFDSLIKIKATFHKTLYSRLLYLTLENNTWLFANGSAYSIPKEHIDFIGYLCKSSNIRYSEYSNYIKNQDCAQLLKSLYTSGVVMVN